MINKLIDAWSDSYRVIENRRAVRRHAERIVWSGRGWADARPDGRQLRLSWI
jgi:hypothetical protein